jgi:hypothetical protein
MKRCPECDRVYDDALIFCFEHGVLLVRAEQPDGEQAAQAGEQPDRDQAAQAEEQPLAEDSPEQEQPLAAGEGGGHAAHGAETQHAAKDRGATSAPRADETNRTFPPPKPATATSFKPLKPARPPQALHPRRLPSHVPGLPARKLGSAGAINGAASGGDRDARAVGGRAGAAGDVLPPASAPAGSSRRLSIRSPSEPERGGGARRARALIGSV